MFSVKKNYGKILKYVHVLNKWNNSCLFIYLALEWVFSTDVRASGCWWTARQSNVKTEQRLSGISWAADRLYAPRIHLLQAVKFIQRGFFHESDARPGVATHFPGRCWRILTDVLTEKSPSHNSSRSDSQMHNGRNLEMSTKPCRRFVKLLNVDAERSNVQSSL